MDPFRICPYCEQSVRIVYKDETNKNNLVFEVHTKKDYLTRCLGSKERVEIESDDSKEKIVEQPDSAILPIVENAKEEEVPKNTVRCPSCKQQVGTKLNLRNNRVFVEHFFPSGLRCHKSMRPLTES